MSQASSTPGDTGLADRVALRARVGGVGSGQEGCLRGGELVVGDHALRVKLCQPSELARDVLPPHRRLVRQSRHRSTKTLHPLGEQCVVRPLRPWVEKARPPGFLDPSAHPCAARSRARLDERPPRQRARWRNPQAEGPGDPGTATAHRERARACAGQPHPFPGRELPDDIGDPVVRQRGRPCVAPLSSCHVRDGIGIARVPRCPRCSGECAHGLQDDHTGKVFLDPDGIPTRSDILLDPVSVSRNCHDPRDVSADRRLSGRDFM